MLWLFVIGCLCSTGICLVRCLLFDCVVYVVFGLVCCLVCLFLVVYFNVWFVTWLVALVRLLLVCWLLVSCRLFMCLFRCCVWYLVTFNSVVVLLFDYILFFVGIWLIRFDCDYLCCLLCVAWV